MKKQMLKAILSLSLVVAMLLTTVLPAWAAEESFELFFGEDLVNLSLYEWATLVYSGVDENVTVSVEAATDGVIELDTENNMFRAVGVGSTVLVATTSDGQSDRALISVREPQAWNGPGTYRVLINGQFPSVLAAFTVPEDGIYEITSDAPYVLYGEILDAEGEYMAYDPMDTYDTGLFLVDRLEAGKTYYLYTYSSEITFEGGIVYEVTLKKSTTYTQNGVYFLRDRVNAACGDILQPDYITIPSFLQNSVTLSTTSTSVECDDVLVYANNAGSATVKAECSMDGAFYSDTITVSVADYRWVNRGTTPVTDIDPATVYQVFAFYADGNHDVSFRCNGGEFVYAELYGDAGLVDYMDTMPIGNFYMDTPMNAGEVVLLYVAYSKYQASIDVLIDKSSPATTLTLSIPDMYAVEKNGDNYLVYQGSTFYLKADFGTAVGVKGEDVTYTISDPSMVEELEVPGLYGMQGVGSFTATAKTASGLTDTINITAIEYQIGDVTRDGTTDMIDAMTVFQHTSGSTGLTGYSLALADQNGDGEIDMIDTFTIFSIASGAPPAGPDLSIDSDNPPTIDPTPGDDVQDGDW